MPSYYISECNLSERLILLQVSIVEMMRSINYRSLSQVFFYYNELSKFPTL